MAIADGGAVNATYTVATGTHALPASTAAGDLLLYHASTSTTGTPPTMPAGWTLITSSTVASHIQMRVWWKRAGAAEPAVSLTGMSGTNITQLRRLTGVVQTGAPFTSAKAGNSGTTASTAVSVSALAPIQAGSSGKIYTYGVYAFETAQTSTAATRTWSGASGTVALIAGAVSNAAYGHQVYFSSETAFSSSTTNLAVTLSTASISASLTFDLIEAPPDISTLHENFATSSVASMWTTNNQIDGSTLLWNQPGELGLTPNFSVVETGTKPQPLVNAYSLIGSSVTFRMRTNYAIPSPFIAQAGVYDYFGGAASLQLSSAGITGKINTAVGTTFPINPQYPIWGRLSESGGTLTLSYSQDGVTWTTALASSWSGLMDPRTCVPFASWLTNGGTTTPIPNPSLFYGWVNSALADGMGYRTNLIADPVGEGSLTAWRKFNSTAAKDTSWPSGGTSIAITPTTVGTKDSFIDQGDTGSLNGLVPGTTYTASGTINIPTVLSGTPQSLVSLRIVVYYKAPSTGTGYVTLYSPQAANAVGATHTSITFTVPADATEAFVRYYNGYDATATNKVQWTNCMVEAAPTLGSYFDYHNPLAGSITPGGQSICVARRINLIYNPDFALSTFDWVPAGTVQPTLSLTTEQFLHSPNSLKIVWGAGGSLPGVSKNTAFPTVPGRTYVLRFSQYAPSVGGMLLAPVIAGLGLVNTSNSWSSDPIARDQWVTRTYEFVATAQTHNLTFWPSSTPAGGEISYLDSAHVEEKVTYDGTLLGSTVGASVLASPNVSMPYLPVNTGMALSGSAMSSVDQAARTAVGLPAWWASQGSAATSGKPVISLVENGQAFSNGSVIFYASQGTITAIGTPLPRDDSRGQITAVGKAVNAAQVFGAAAASSSASYGWTAAGLAVASSASRVQPLSSGIAASSGSVLIARVSDAGLRTVVSAVKLAELSGALRTVNFSGLMNIVARGVVVTTGTVGKPAGFYLWDGSKEIFLRFDGIYDGLGHVLAASFDSVYDPANPSTPTPVNNKLAFTQTGTGVWQETSGLMTNSGSGVWADQTGTLKSQGNGSWA